MARAGEMKIRPGAPAAPVRVVVLYSPAPRRVREWPLVLAAGATVRQALQACPVQSEFPDLDLASAELGVWGHAASLGQALGDGDRIEIYRPLTVDPKLARRERFRRQGVRAAGLFAKDRK